MTHDEFFQWLKTHRSGFTGLNIWLNRLPDPGEENDGEPNRRDVLQQWYRALRDVELTHANSASEAMFAGTLPEPKGYDRHPAAIRAYALGLHDQACRSRGSYAAPRRVEGHDAYRCLHCEDDGWRRCWHPATVRKIIETGEFTPPLYACVAACGCEAGAAVLHAGNATFDGNKFCELPRGGMIDPDAQAALLEWIDAHQQAHTAAPF